MVLGRNDMMGEEYLPPCTFARNVTFYRSTPCIISNHMTQRRTGLTMYDNNSPCIPSIGSKSQHFVQSLFRLISIPQSCNHHKGCKGHNRWPPFAIRDRIPWSRPEIQVPSGSHYTHSTEEYQLFWVKCKSLSRGPQVV